MDGSETGWGRPEPAPRWRALLDRARLGGRAADHGDPPRDQEKQPADPPPRGGDHRHGVDGGYPGYGEAPPGESRYALLDNRYLMDPEPEPRYGLLDRGYRPGPQDQGWTEPPEQGYRPGPPDQGYRPPPPDQGWTEPPEQGYRPGPPDQGYRTEAFDHGYVAEPAYPPPPPAANPPIPIPPPPPAVNPVLPVHPAPVSAFAPRTQWGRSTTGNETDRAAGVLRRDLGTPRVLAFANPKGGVHKTTATVLAAATIGSVRGRGVLAWDDNELRGTLGLRAGSARHARTIRHLITDLAQVEILPDPVLLNQLDDYLRHASDGSYDVLAGEESPKFAHRLDRFTVQRVLDLLRRTHNVICVDTGNNVESENWRTVMQAADQLVLTTVPREDAAFSADWMLDLLHEVGMGELAANAVTLISCPTPGRSPLQNDLERHFATRTRAVAVVPYDPALETGSSIEYHQLQQETRDAWLRAASAMLEPFAR